MSMVRPCRKNECSIISEIINAAAEAYRGVIPADRWHDPYISLRELIGVMGIQAVRDVDLIRHAYVRPGSQRRGIGAALIGHIRSLSSRQMLVGTWAAATWAITFYQRHGFELVSPEQKTALLKTYWTVPERQIETSVVMANLPLSASA